MNTAGTSAITELIAAGQVKARPNRKGKYVSLLFNGFIVSSPPPAPTDPKAGYSEDPAKLKYCTDGTSQTFMWFETGADPIKYINGAPNGEITMLVKAGLSTKTGTSSTTGAVRPCSIATTPTKSTASTLAGAFSAWETVL